MDAPEGREFESVRERLGERIRKLRVSSGLSQEALSDLAECHTTYVSMIDRKLWNPSLKVLTQIAASLGTKIDDLLR